MGKLLHHTGLAVVRECVHYTRRELHNVSWNSLWLHLKVAAILSIMDWEKIDRSWTAQVEMSVRRTSQWSIKKFEKLVGLTHLVPPLDATQAVINLSSKYLDSATTLVLAKRLNFAIDPWRLPIK